MMLELCGVHDWTFAQYKQNPPQFNSGMWMALMERRREQARQSKPKPGRR